MSKQNKINQQEFLLRFFIHNVDKNEVIKLNGFILFKHWDGNNHKWRVDIFTPESYLAMKERKLNPIQKEKLF